MENNITSPLDFEPRRSVSKKKYLIIISSSALVVLFTMAGYLYWESYLSSEAEEKKYAAEQVERFDKATAEFETAMKADTYGGLTPSSTLDMFVEALKKNDLELASKYFLLDTNPASVDYLTRKKLEEGLKKTQEKNELQTLVSKVSSAKFAGSSLPDVVGFEIRNKDGSLEADINLKLNPYTNIWKIESF